MGPMMIHMAYMPLYSEEMRDVTPLDRCTHGQKVGQYSAWAKRAISIFLGEGGIFLTDYSHRSLGDLIDVTLADEAVY